jgi:hypothetical protein
MKFYQIVDKTVKKMIHKSLDCRLPEEDFEDTKGVIRG